MSHPRNPLTGPGALPPTLLAIRRLKLNSVCWKDLESLKLAFFFCISANSKHFNYLLGSPPERPRCSLWIDSWVFKA